MSADSRSETTNDTAPGVPNRVRAGTIGIVGSAAGASREVAVRVHDFGGGVSRVIATAAGDGEHGAAASIGEGLRRLGADPGTEVIVLALREPSAADATQIGDQLRSCGKPVVVVCIGGSADALAGSGVTAVTTTKEAALQAVLLTGTPEEDIDLHSLNWPLIGDVRQKLTPEQRYVRGLFVGSDVCAEAMYLAIEKYDDVYANVHPDAAHRLGLESASTGHTFLDFSAGGPDGGNAAGEPARRVARFREEADDREVGVITLDFLLGEGAAEDPVGDMAAAIGEAKERAAAQGRHLEVLAYVLGTDLDTPDLAEQVRRLEAVGATIASSSANTGLLSREFVAKQ